MISKAVVASVLGLMLLALFAVGCSESNDATTDEGDGDGGPYTTPEALITAHEEAWEARDYDAYAALLGDEFAFYPLQEDANDLPWLEGDSWDRTAELGMVHNMFDPNFSEGNGAVDLIEFVATPQGTQTNSQGRIEVTCVVVGRVMWTPSDGAVFDTRLIFEFIERDGSLLIREIREIPRTLSAGRVSSVENNSFGALKNLYR